jgi:deoxyribodipyrimidine photolyase-related protein
MYNVWRKMKPEAQTALLEQADYYLKNIMNYKNGSYFLHHLK